MTRSLPFGLTLSIVGRVVALVVVLTAALPAAAPAQEFALPEKYWPKGFAWHEHVYSGWRGASIFRPGRSNPKEYPVLKFATPGAPRENRIGGYVHATPELARQSVAHLTRDGPVASDVADATCWKVFSNERIWKGYIGSSTLQFRCVIGRVKFYVDLRSQSNRGRGDGGATLLNKAVPLTELHKVASAIVAGFRQYAVDNGLLAVTDRISAALFPDPAVERPDGWWWAKSAGAVYEIHGRPKKHQQSWTPSWSQDIEISTAQGYGFKPYRYRSDGSGSWCRPGKNGKCDLPFQRVGIVIDDFLMHGGQEACVESLNTTLQGGGIYSRISAEKIQYSRGNPDQFGIMFCRNGFHVTVSTVGRREAAVPATVRYYADVVARKIDGVPIAPTGGGGNMAGGVPQPGSGADALTNPGTPGSGPSTSEVALTAAGAAAAGGIAGVGAWLMLGQAGVGRREALDAMGDLLRGNLPSDGFEDWKAKYEGLGWTYREENGIAYFEPPPDAIATPPPPEIDWPQHRDGDVNPDTDEVWSEEDGGWIGRNLYEQEKRRASEIADVQARGDRAMAARDDELRALGREVADAGRQREALAKAFEERQRLEDAIHDIWKQDVEAGTLDENRQLLLDQLAQKAEDLSLKAVSGPASAELGALGDIVSQQARAGFVPTYTYKDAVFDTGVQIGAAALDAVLTRGYASSALGSGLAMRDAAREGKSVTEIAYAGVKAAVMDFAIGRTAHYVGEAAGVARSAWREAGEAADDAARVMERLRGPTGTGGDVLAEAERNLRRMEKNLGRDAVGRPKVPLDDALEVQRKPHQVRRLKETGGDELQDGFNNTMRMEVYKPHDKALIDRIRGNQPDLADKKLVVHEFRTPGKSSSGINTDRDFRVLYKNDKGDWIEVPKDSWKKDSNEVFADLTGYDASKPPPGFTDAEKKAWWADQHGHTATDRSFREACPDYSDQVVSGQSEWIRVEKPRIEELKDIAARDAGIPKEPIRLRDPPSIGQQFDEKIHNNLRRGDLPEAVAQAQKGVETLETVRKAYDKQGLDAGALPSRFQEAMDVIARSDLPHNPDTRSLIDLEEKLGRLGFANVDEFGKSLSGQFESLKLAKSRVRLHE